MKENTENEGKAALEVIILISEMNIILYVNYTSMNDNKINFAWKTKKNDYNLDFLEIAIIKFRKPKESQGW